MALSWRSRLAGLARIIVSAPEPASPSPGVTAPLDPNATRRHALLVEAGTIFNDWLRDDRAAESLARSAAAHLGEWCTIDLIEEGSLRRRGSAHADPQRGHEVDHLFHRLAAAMAFYPTAETIQTLETRMCDPAPGREDTESCLLAPIRARDRTWGLITLASARRRYDAADRSLMEDLAQRTALAVEAAWLYRELHHCRSRLDAVLRHVPTAVVVAEAPSGRWVLANDAVERMFRYSMAGARTLADWSECRAFTRDGRPYRAEEWPLARSMASGETIVREEMEIVRGDATRGLIHVSAFPIHEGDGRIVGCVATFEDFTAHQRAEEATKTDKLESIGLLAGGIAHDFNNVLTAISGHLFLVKTAPGLDREVVEQVDEAEHAALRARRLTQQLLTFAPGGSPLKRPTDIARLVRDTAAAMLERSPVQSDLHIPEDVWPGDVDESQIRHVIEHVIANAREAMPEQGAVTVKIRNRVVGPDDRLPLDPGRYVVIWIIDQGVGIPATDLPRVFDPYFTTKPAHSGLGLATCYSIVKRHRGYLTVDSTPGVRTTFTVYLPAALEPGHPPAPVPASPQAAAVLFMDDEPSISDVAVEMLTRFGYRAEAVPGGAQAVDRYRRALAEGRPFDLVIFDLTVPGGMGGIPALAALRDIDPHVTAVASSGYSSNPVMADYARHGFTAVLPKPYDGDQLREVVAHALERRRRDIGKRAV